MRREKIVLIKMDDDRSRAEAREMMRKLYPEIDWYTHYVHHKDKNPLNNNLDNLLIIERRKHIILHRSSYSTHLGDHLCRFCGRKTVNLKCLCGKRNP